MSRIPTRAILPQRYRILPEVVPFRLREFERWYRTGNSVLAPTDRDVASWFDAFAEEVIDAVSTRHLPIVRLSDGEFRLLFGPRPASSRAPLTARAKSVLEVVGFKLNPWVQLVAGPSGQYESGTYRRDELRELRSAFAAACRQIADQGYLALHLEHGQVPFVEQYFPPLGRWLEANGIQCTSSTYVPFYFVYALLAGSHRERLLRERNILVVTHADAEKQQQIERSLTNLGASSVSWLNISQQRSAFDRLNITRHQLQKLDMALVAGGLGAPMLIHQLRGLCGPVLDVGYMVEVWANPDFEHDRPFSTR